MDKEEDTGLIKGHALFFSSRCVGKIERAWRFSDHTCPACRVGGWMQAAMLPSRVHELLPLESTTMSNKSDNVLLSPPFSFIRWVANSSFVRSQK